MGGVEIVWGIYYLLVQFHYFISLETANTQKNEVFLLRISPGKLNP